MRTVPNLPENQVTDPAVYLRRREFLRTSAAAGAALAAGLPALAACGSENPGEARADAPEPKSPPRALAPVTPAPARFRAEDPLTPEKDAKSYNNFYEMGTDKDDPARNAHRLRTEPWSVSLTGEIAKPGVIALEDLLRPHPLEERIYRLRCVEAWSMVIPWVGVPLGDVIRRLNPGSKARYVAFETLLDPEQLPGQKRRVLDWPYREGLRMDEAMHPLTILAVGMYGQSLPGQNGAPLRLVVPWKYGFKSIKSIVGIRLQAEEPVTAWNQSAPGEYGFYANVNPEVSHPRWSQARERRIGDWRKRPTLPFNGYGEQVAALYAGMDLRRNF